MVDDAQAGLKRQFLSYAVWFEVVRKGATLNQKDLYELIQEIEQCGYSAERAHDIAENMEDNEEMEEVREGLEIILLELCELKRNLRERIRSVE